MPRRALPFFVSFLLSAAAGSPEVQPPAQDSCLPLLTVTGRDLLQQVTAEEVGSYYYSQLCDEHGNSLDASASSSSADLFRQVKNLFSFNYESQSSYCRSESSRYARRSYDSLRVSRVVTESTRAFIKCRELSKMGIVVTPDLYPEKATFTLSLGGSRTLGQIKGVETTAETSCHGNIKGESVSLGKTIQPPVSLKPSESFSIICDRSAIRSAVPAGRSVYPETLITITTSDDTLNVKLPQAPVATETWANDNNDGLKALQTRLEDAQRRLSSLETSTIHQCRVCIHRGGQGTCPAGDECSLYSKDAASAKESRGLTVPSPDCYFQWRIDCN